MTDGISGRAGAGAARRPRPCFDWDLAARWLLLVVLALVFLTFRDYGISWDEAGQNTYGKLLLAYYTSGFADRSAFSFANLFYYGGAFDLAAALANAALPLDEYETRHLLGGLVGVAGLAGAWRLGRELGGPRAGFIALALLATTARYYGDMFTNPKDLPLAAALVWTLYFMARALREMPAVRIGTSLGLGLAFGLALGIRVGAVIILPSLLLPWLWRAAHALRDGQSPSQITREALITLRGLAPAVALALAVAAVSWPWAVQEPGNPLRALAVFSRFPFDGQVLFEGRLVPAMDLPPDYLTDWLLIGLPLTLLAGAAVGAIGAIRRTVRDGYAWNDARGLGIAAVFLAVCIPVAYAVLATPPLYNGFRHFLFVVPPLAVLAGLAFHWLLDWAGRHGGAAWLVLVVGLASEVVAMGRLHPAESVYFNAIIGGVDGAEGRYELDYWGISLRETTLQLIEHLSREATHPPRRYRVYVCADSTSAAHYFPDWLELAPSRDQADFQIAVNQFYCTSPPGSVRLVETERLGALLSYADDLRTAGPAGHNVYQAESPRTKRDSVSDNTE